MSARKDRSRQMMATPGYGSQIARGIFKIRSQTDPEKYYEVKQDGNKLVCSCSDHFKRMADCKHIHTALDMIRKKRCYANKPVRILERAKIPICKHCDSGRIKKSGVRKNKKRITQRYACLDCKKRFTANFGFENMRYDPRTITQALQMYYQGMSVRDIECNLEMVGIDVDHSSIYDWITKYSTIALDYIENIVPRTNDRTMVRADEVWVKVKGEYKYLFASMDDDTRYWLTGEMAHTKFQHNADTLLELTKKKIAKSPAHFVTDGLPAYDSSSVKVFGKDTNHIKHIHLAGKRDRDNNNKMERLNGEIRDREKVFRGLKRFDTPIIPGMKAYYNFAKKHSGINGMTPAEASLIEIDGRNKWFTLIQNASLHRNSV